MSEMYVNDEEYKRRFIERVMERSRMTDDEALAVWSSVSPDDWRELGAEPEDAADEEMSCWDDDGG